MARLPRPLRAAPLSSRLRPVVVTWMNEPSIYEPLDLQPPIGPHHLMQRQLPIHDRDGSLIMEPAMVYELTDATGKPFGFGVSYAWEDDQRDIREMDIALPGLGKSDPGAVIEIFMRLTHAVIKHERCAELRTGVRAGVGNQGLDRLFEGFGCTPLAGVEGANVRGHFYRLFPPDFYASRLAKRYDITPGS
jgi:hypothetical protein